MREEIKWQQRAICGDLPWGTEITATLLGGSGEEFLMDRRMHSRPEDAFFLQTGHGKLCKPCFLQKPAAPSWSCPDSGSSLSQLDMKKEALRRALHFPFSCKRFLAHQRWMARGERDKGARTAPSQPHSYRELQDKTGWTKRGCSACPGSGLSLQEHGALQRQRSGQATAKREEEAHGSVHNGISVNTVRLQRQ